MIPGATTSHDPAPVPRPFTPWRGKLRTARKRHECAGCSEQDEYGYTYYASPEHFIEVGEQYIDARHVWPEWEDYDGQTHPMGSIPMRCCIDCAESRGYIPYGAIPY